jgi:nucleoside-diphosphate-sugar epimerase
MILVTGGTGLLGTHLILALHQMQQPVRALYRSHIPAIIKDKAEWIQADILDVVALETAMQDITQVYHSAGLVSFHPKHRQQLFDINVQGTANVVNASLKAGIEKLIHVSSVAAMGRIRNGAVINESMHWNDETSGSEYSRTKYLGEMEVWRGIGEGLNAVIVNPTIIFGEHGDWTKGSMNMFRTIRNGFPWYSMGGSGFVDADDVAEAMIALMQSEISEERFLVTAENRTYSDLFFMIADAFGLKRPHKKVTPFLAALIWRLEKIRSLFTRKDPLVTKETAKTSLALVEVDNSKLLKALPSFSYQPLQQSIQRICTAIMNREK